MKQLVVLLCLTFLFGACRKSKDITPQFQNTHWELVEMDGKSIASLRPTIESLQGTIPTLHFYNNGKADGKMFCIDSKWESGSFMFTYDKKHKQYYLSKSSITTKDICNSNPLSLLNLEFRMLLDQASTFKEEGDELFFYTYKDNKELKFKRL